MAKPQKQSSELVQRDGALCVTFVNTATAKRHTLATYADLLAWGEQNGALSSAEAERLERAAAERPADAEGALQRAQELRDRLERILLALASKRTPDASDIDALNAELAHSSRRLIPAAGGGYRWSWTERGGDELERLLLPVVLSAADILASKDHRRVRQCGGKGCVLLFVDRSPGSHRRWCSQESCGSRARASRRYYATIKPWRDERRRQFLESLLPPSLREASNDSEEPSS